MTKTGVGVSRKQTILAAGHDVTILEEDKQGVPRSCVTKKGNVTTENGWGQPRIRWF